ncbi:MAG: hypothetical protein PVG39_03665 [Desulfobacteraceae bacterium]|jgi:hypothetical protein
MNNKTENNMNKDTKSIPDNMTEITLTAGDTMIPALLNNSRSSKELIAILYKDEEISGQFGNLVTLGRIDCPLSVMDTLDSSITVTIDLKV